MRGHEIQGKLNCELLEARDTPAGNVTAMVFGGTVVVTGDSEFNRIQIAQDGAGNMFAAGLEGTTVNGQSVVFVGQGVPDGVSVSLGDGQDYLEMMGVFAGGISIEGGNDGDGLWLWNVGTAGNLEIRGSE